MLIEMSSCPKCGNGTRSPCYATYTDGYKCFRCGVFKKATRTLLSTEKEAYKVLLPDHTSNPNRFTIDALEYLYSYHFTDEMIKKHNIKQSGNGNVLYSIFDKGECNFFVEREPRKGGSSKNHGERTPVIVGDGSALVVVEDYLSMSRVSRHAATLCLFGTSIRWGMVKHIVAKYDKIILWLDGDQAGQDASKVLVSKIYSRIKFINKGRLLSRVVDVRSIKTKNDPKCYTDTEIKGEINGNRDKETEG